MSTALAQQQALIQALTGAAGEAVNDFCGLRLSRLTSDVAAGSVVLPVERTVGWPAQGRVTVDGAVYHYTANNDGALLGIYYLVGGVQTPGTRAPHRALAAVIDASQTFSALDLLRRGLLVAYAQDDDLNALGRNLGVLRLPDVRTDDQFRTIVQSLAYNPKGTVYGLELALSALVGAGNYTIVEDLQNHPNQVQISVPSSLFLSSVPQGRAYLTGPVTLVPSAGAFTYAFPGATPTSPYARVESITLVDTNVWTDARTALPSAATDGWTYDGAAAESAAYAQVPSLGYKPSAAQAARYVQAAAPVRPDSLLTLRALFAVPDATKVNAGNTLGQHGGTMQDGTTQYAWGIYANTATTYYVAMRNTSTNAPVGASMLLAQGVYYEVSLHKRPDGYCDLRVNGALVDRQPAAAFVATTATLKPIGYGCQTPGSLNPAPITRYLGAYVHSDADFWSASGTDSTLASSAPTRLQVASAPFVAGDVGRQLQIRGSLAKNAQGGNNNCVMQVAAVLSASQVTLVAPSQPSAAQVSAVYPTRVTVPNSPAAFTYPDDLGKSLTLENSTQGNGGTYTIVALLDPNSGVDLSTAATRVTSTTNLCVVQGAAFVPESGISYHLTPAFVTETGAAWNLSDAGSMVGPSAAFNYTITPRQPLMYPGASYNVSVNTVLSAQVLAVDYVINKLQSLGPPASFSYWPFYVIDPFNFVEVYLQGIVAAGVQVVFSFY